MLDELFYLHRPIFLTSEMKELTCRVSLIVINSPSHEEETRREGRAIGYQHGIPQDSMGKAAGG